MSLARLTTEQATALYMRRQAFGYCPPGPYSFVTRTAFYAWVPPTPTEEGYFERTHDGLRVQHHYGVRWDTFYGQFLPCDCDSCQRHPEEAEEVDLY